MLMAFTAVGMIMIFVRPESEASEEQSYVAGELIVQVKDFLPDNLEDLGVHSVEQICQDKKGHSNIYVLHFDAATDIPNKKEELLLSGEFDWVEPNGFVKACMIPNDSMFFRQYGLQNLGTFNLTMSTVDSDSDLPEAWDIEQGDSNVVVAVLDGGIALAHPEFLGRIWRNYNEIPNDTIDNDLNGYVDDYRGWNFAYDTNSPADDLGHGTSVAGVIGANGNNVIGMSGVDWFCKLMICKVLDANNFGTYADIADAIYYATNNGADIINMSFAGGSSSVITAAVQYAWNNNVVMCAASGNGNTSVPSFPAADSLVLAVGGSNAWDVRYQFSNYGSHLDVVAAGDYIYILDYSNFSNYSNYSGGTSFASPFVAGVAALLKAQDTSRTNFEIYNIIRTTADDTIDHYTSQDTQGWDQYFGYGRVNAHDALLYDSLALAIPSVASENQLHIYPNPFSDQATIYSDVMLNDATMEIYNSTGQMVRKVENVSGQVIALERAELVSGSYLIVVRENDISIERNCIIISEKN
jgi:subtilisin family serine protease